MVQSLLITVLGLAQILPVRTFTVRDGLASNDVRSIAQDSLGFLWVGSTDGINRYDGVSFHRRLLPGGLPANFINEVITGADGAVWVATNYRGVSVFRDTGSVMIDLAPHLPASSFNRVNRVHFLRSGGELFGTDGGLVRLENGTLRLFHADDPDLQREVFAILRGSGGELWVGGTFGLLSARGGNLGQFSRLRALPAAQVFALLEAPGRDLWVATDRGVFICRESAGSIEPSNTSVHILPFTRGHLVHTMMKDRDGTIWIGTDAAGLFRVFPDGSHAEYTSHHGIPGNTVRALLQDRQGNIWIGTNAGLGRLGSTRFVSYPLYGGLAGASVGSIARDRRGRMWLGTPHGLSKLDGERFLNYSETAGLPGNYILSLLNDRQGNLWAGTVGGLARLDWDLRGDRFTAVPAERGPGGRIIRTIYQDGDDILWFGHEGGVGARDRGRFQSFPPPSVFQSGLVLAVVRDRHGFLWVGSQGDGLYVYEVGRDRNHRLTLRELSRVTRSQGLSDDNIRALAVARDGAVWAGTRFGGLNRILHDRGVVTAIAQMGRTAGLSGESVRSLVVDTRGFLWVATNGGVDRVAFDSNGVFSATTVNFRDGLAGDGGMSVFEDSDGVLWMGATNGVTRYEPGGEEDSGVPPPVYIVRCLVMGEERPDLLRGETAQLDYNEFSLSFDFIGLSFADEGAVYYRYMLEGLDSDWSPLTDRRYVNYTHLPPGRYVFRVLARSGRGEWSAKAASLRFSIATPYWQGWWFITGVAVTLAGLILAAHKIRVRRLLEIERVRSRIAADLHDDIGSTLSSISVFSKMAEQQLDEAGAPAASLVRRIGENARSVMESLDDIVWMVRPENDPLESMIQRIRDYTADTCGPRGIAARVSASSETDGLQLPLESRRQVYLLVKEAVHNAICHSEGTEVFVSFSWSAGFFHVRVEDDGSGFDPGTVRQGHGLENMKKRAAAVGARLGIAVPPGGGTIVNLDVPIA